MLNEIKELLMCLSFVFNEQVVCSAFFEKGCGYGILFAKVLLQE